MQYKIFSIGQMVTWDRTLLQSEAPTIDQYKKDLGSPGPYQVTGVYDVTNSRRLTSEEEIRTCVIQAVYLNGGDEYYNSLWLESTS